MAFDTKRISSAPDAIAPDGSEVRILCQVGRGGMAHFALPPRAVSRTPAHRTVEAIWANPGYKEGEHTLGELALQCGATQSNKLVVRPPGRRRQANSQVDG